MSFTVTSKMKMAGIHVIEPVGRLNSNTYPMLEELVDEILKEVPEAIVFDMAMLDYISSMGVRVIAKAQKALKEINGKIVLMRLQPQIKKVFDIVRALPSEQVFGSMEELDAYLDHMQKQMAE
ncbi:MAG: STAS domain-containing protein [Thermodesulfobacteriota bacterium]|nr:STAS domain-containing protein [Thermodesulfobacteriota bacterium]